MLRGMGVTMALPWMESLPVWGDEAPRTGAASEAPVRLAVLFSGNGFHSKEWWAKGEGAQMELGKVLAPLGRLPREDAVHPRAVQRRGAEGEHPQLADRQPAFRRAAGFRRRDPFGHQHRPVGGAALRAIDQSAEPGAGMREVEPVGPQELLDALQLAHFVEFADDTHAAGNLSGARVRPAVQGRSAARATRACSTRCWRTRASLRREHQHARSAQARRVPRLGARRRAAHRTTPASRANCKAGGPRSTSRTCRGRPTEFRRTSPSTCG